MAEPTNLLGIDRRTMEVSQEMRELTAQLNGLIDERRRTNESDADVYARLAMAKDEDLKRIERQRDALLPKVFETMEKRMLKSDAGTAAEQLAALKNVGDEVVKGALAKRERVDAILEKRIVELQAERGVHSRSQAWALAATDPVCRDAYALSNQLGEEAAAQLRAAGL
jgi:hypothetical protein